jgi:hypothetical protein
MISPFLAQTKNGVQKKGRGVVFLLLLLASAAVSFGRYSARKPF